MPTAASSFDVKNMPYENRDFINGEIYHLTLRAIDNNLLFKDINDYYRGVFSVYEFNNANPVTIQARRKARVAFKRFLQREMADRALSSIQSVFTEEDKRKKLVEVMAFCLMPNHVHLLIKQIDDGGISKFMQKIGGGYGGYFNRKYQRKGHVFMDRFEDVMIKSDIQLKIIFVYIHANPLSLIEPGWKKIGIKNPEEATKFLEEYKWSSYPDYIGGRSFPSVTDREFLLEEMGGVEGCKSAIKNWVTQKAEIAQFSGILLDYQKN